MKRFAENAFTLVELMVVVALIAIMTALIVPEMKGTFEDELLRSTGRELINVFNLACSRAVSFNQSHRVRLNWKTGRYFVERPILEDGREVFVPLRDVPGSDGKLDTRIAILTRQSAESGLAESPSSEAPEAPATVEGATATDEVITFYPDGTADEDAIVLRDRDGFRLALRINPITARVRVIELARESANFNGAGE